LATGILGGGVDSQTFTLLKFSRGWRLKMAAMIRFFFGSGKATF